MDKIMVIKCTIHVCSILLLVWRLHPLLYLKKITSPLSPWPFLSVSRALGLFGIVTASLFHGKSKLNSPNALRLTCVGCPLATANRGSWTERPKISKATSQPRYAYKLRDFLAPGPKQGQDFIGTVWISKWSFLHGSPKTWRLILGHRRDWCEAVCWYPRLE